MIFQTSKGDILDDGSDYLFCPVNCRGVMGKGLAKAFAERWPHLPGLHRHFCMKERSLTPGRPAIVSMQDAKGSPFLGLTGRRRIILFPTKDDWRKPSRLEWIRNGLEYILVNTHKFSSGSGPQSFAIPALGCGLGGLDFDPVESLIMQFALELPRPCSVTLYLPKESR